MLRYCIWIALAPALAGAQPLDDLVAEALRNNREILAAQKRYEAARQRPAQTAALPDPMVSLGYTANGYPYPGAGLGRDVTSNLGVMVSQEMPFPGKRKLRGEIAGKEAGAEFERYLATRLSVVARVKQTYHELHHAIVAAGFVERYQELLGNMLRISEARYSVGRAAQQDVFKGQTQLAVFQAQLLRYRQERASKELELNALLGRPPGSAVEIPEELPVGELPLTQDQMLERAREHAPELARERNLVERGQLSASLARRDFYPDYTVAGGYFNQGGMPPMWQFRVDVKLPAQRAARRAALAEREFETAEARHNYESAAVNLEARVRTQYSLAETARKLVDLYEKSVLPGGRLALESSMTAYQTGAVDFLSVFSNFMSVVEYEMARHEEIMRFHIALASLEEMTGGNL
jgi:outer membrane protein TolC